MRGPRGLRRSAPVVVLTIAVTLLGACGGDEGSETKVVGPNASRVTMPVGGKVVFALPSNPGTGYSWSVDRVADPSVVTAAGQRFVAPRTNRIGAEGTELLTFVAKRKGTTTIELVYQRPFDPGGPGTQTKTYRVTVT
jgi:inhibitor of cysteine peptidase